MKKWLGEFSFLDAMLFDTPIFDESVRNLIKESIESLSIQDRYTRTCIFKNYLINYWTKMSSKPAYFDLMDIFSKEEASFESIKKSIDKSSGYK